ncbi:MAG: hypothetical protein H7Z19_14950 [Chitinophagaceae bacterium]|nr:hypothetical protein [Rubrivivax sp.]
MRTFTAALITALVLTGAAQADNAAMQRCRQMAEAAQRLACYDRIELTTSPAAAPAAAAAASMAAAQSPSAAPLRPAAAERFGLARSTDPTEVDAIESTLARNIDGWRANEVITLTNGQQWQISDDSSGVTPPGTRKVRVRRGMLGAFYLEFEGLNRSPRVRRVQ